MTLAEKINKVFATSNEVAIGWNDSGCYWHFRYGDRGAGDMMAGIGKRFSALDAETFEEAVDAFLKHREEECSA